MSVFWSPARNLVALLKKQQRNHNGVFFLSFDLLFDSPFESKMTILATMPADANMPNS